MRYRGVSVTLAVAVAVVVCFLVYFYVKEGFTNNSRTIEIIISRYNENLEWLKNVNTSKCAITIYNKGTNDKFYKPDGCKIVPLKNVGRESHTYLYHVIENYARLPDLLICLPGSCDIPHKKSSMERIMQSVNTTDDVRSTFAINVQPYENGLKNGLYDFTIDNYKATDTKNRDLNPDNRLVPAPIRPFGKWYEAHFNKDVKHVLYGGVFSISNAHVHQYPKTYYQTLITELEVSPNVEVGHYYERAWVAVFGADDNVNYV